MKSQEEEGIQSGKNSEKGAKGQMFIKEKWRGEKEQENMRFCTKLS